MFAIKVGHGTIARANEEEASSEAITWDRRARLNEKFMVEIGMLRGEKHGMAGMAKRSANGEMANETVRCEKNRQTELCVGMIIV